ncbi:hypothetical protein TRIP_B200088 [uncultured Desulfatiglans sp.]|nr:hypothetical protein TRIP_B200088 [uncultured Desulfatiglans sp.]
MAYKCQKEHFRMEAQLLRLRCPSRPNFERRGFTHEDHRERDDGAAPASARHPSAD